MKSCIQYKQVSLQDIDVSENNYLISPFPEQKTKNTDFFLLHPPLLLAEGNQFQLIAGKTFLPPFAQDDATLITALVINKDKTVEQQLIFKLLFDYKLLHSPPSIIEQAIYFQKVIPLLPQEEIAKQLSLLGYKKNHTIAEDLITLLQLDVSVQRALHEGILTSRAARLLCQFKDKDQKAISALIETFYLGASKQQKLVKNLLELTKRSGTPCRELIKEWQKTQKDTQGNGPQQAASLLQWLDECCHPRAKKAEEEFLSFCQQLNLPETMHVHHTKSFEDEQLTLCIHFSSKKQLVQQLEKLKK